MTGVESPKLFLENNCDRNFDDTNDFAYIKCLIIEYLPSIVVTFSNLLAPFVFSRLITLEEYEANTTLLLNLARNIFLRMASVLVTLFSLQKKVNCDYAQGCRLQDDQGQDIMDFTSQNCSNYELFKACSNERFEGNLCDKPICWETYVGQQLYKLSLVDFIVQVHTYRKSKILFFNHMPYGCNKFFKTCFKLDVNCQILES